MLQKILILDKDLTMCQKFSNLLRSNGYITASTSCNKEAQQLIKSTEFDLILCDSELKNTYPVDFLLKIKNLRPEIPIISISESQNIQTAVELMKSGAFYFMLKPINPARLLDIIQSALLEANPSKGKTSQQRILEGEVAKRQNSDVSNNNIIRNGYPYIRGNSPAAANLYRSIELVAPTDYTVIIKGETGTGKESVARLIHEQSNRSNGPFIAVDCGSLSKELAASELFGHEKGAFTGALQSREGAFVLANNGTIFLDEIGNLSYEVQLLLLRAIQERIVRKVGCVQEKAINVRLIVASNEDLYEATNKRKFREDLYHRLNEFAILVPSLRERMDDFPAFVEAFVLHAGRRLNKEIKLPTDRAMDVLQTYDWPGNIRELLNTIKKACLFTPAGNAITEQYLPCEVKLNFNGKDNEMDEAPFNETNSPVIYADRSKSLKDVAIDAELSTIMSTLKSVKFNKSKAAQILNIDRKTLYNKLKKVNI